MAKTDRSRKDPIAVLVLAAGEGTRMNSSIPKVLHPLCGTPMLGHVLETVRKLKPSSIGIVVGHGGQEVKKTFEKDAGVHFIRQKQQKGSGHAVQSAMPWIKTTMGKSRHLLVLCGDTPLISQETLSELLRFHASRNASATVLTSHFADPFGYGRILRNGSGKVLRIVEEKDASPEEKKIQEVNSGIYCFDMFKLVRVLPHLKNNNAKREYYLTDVLGLLDREQDPAEAFSKTGNGSRASQDETLGINTRTDLAEAEQILQGKILRDWMSRGVTILNPAYTYISARSEIGRDTTLLPGTMILGQTKIGGSCRIGPNTLIENSVVGHSVSVLSSFIYGSKINDGAQIGPFSHLRSGTVVGRHARIGNFTEVKNSRIGRETKVSHLSYIGDSELGDFINVGAGAITCNFDGKNKHPTFISSKSFIGSNVNLIAPVKIGKGAVIGAGSTISKDVPAGSLALERSEQIIKEGWTKKHRR